MKSSWFEVDRKGLAAQMAHVPTWRLVAELIQNAWDEQSTRVAVRLEPQGGGYLRVTVADDNPDGFADLADAWTIFAPSKKAGNVGQRGRFNIGEKMLLALARFATITTTTGQVRFDAAGRSRGREKREVGSEIVAEFRTREPLAKILADLALLMPPPTIITTINDTPLEVREPLAAMRETLPTVTVDEDGALIHARRPTTVTLYPAAGLEGHIFELGIPVVPIDLPWHVNVEQKVPLNRDRDNVPPAFLQTIRVVALNAMHDRMPEPEFTADWARAAAGDERATPAAVETSLTARFGEKRVAYDPSDKEANRIATAKGYTVVASGSLSRQEWDRARPTLPAAGRVTPSPKPYGAGGRPLEPLRDDQITPATDALRKFAHRIAVGLGWRITVLLTSDAAWPFTATFGTSKQLVINVAKTRAITRKRLIDLLIHEFAHHDGSQHLEEQYWRNLSDIGAQIAELALENPDLFEASDLER